MATQSFKDLIVWQRATETSIEIDEVSRLIGGFIKKLSAEGS